MRDALVVQNSPEEGPGLLGGLLEADGFAVRIVDARTEAMPEGIPDLTVILGGPESANDPLPYLEAEQDMIRGRIRDGSPLLGICLGAQLIARALGARVYRGREPEFGYYGDLVPEPSGMLAGLGSPFTAFHWHGDTFDLPDGAERLASSGAYPNQAFRYGSAVGLQFHLEADAAMIRRWTGAAAPGRDPEETRREAGLHAAATAESLGRMYVEFKALAGL